LVGIDAPSLTNDIPSLSTLIDKPVSASLVWHVIDIAYAYCYAQRVYNGDWGALDVDATDCAALIGALSPIMTKPTTISYDSATSVIDTIVKQSLQVCHHTCALLSVDWYVCQLGGIVESSCEWKLLRFNYS
jgi:hypothetical protein